MQGVGVWRSVMHSVTAGDEVVVSGVSLCR